MPITITTRGAKRFFSLKQIPIYARATPVLSSLHTTGRLTFSCLSVCAILLKAITFAHITAHLTDKPVDWLATLSGLALLTLFMYQVVFTNSYASFTADAVYNIVSVHNTQSGSANLLTWLVVTPKALRSCCDIALQANIRWLI